jgi:hypothetical protein
MDTQADDQDVEIIEEEDSSAPKGPFARYWEKVGGGSFTVSLLLHAAFVVIAILIVIASQGGEPERPEVDFLSGGGGGTDGNTQIHKQKQKMMMNRAPAVKISSAVASNVSIPNTTSTITNFSNLSATSGMMSGTPGTGGGFGGGKGRGRGTGIGDGFGPGSGPGFVANFLGLVSNGNNIIFCIDTSGSMRTNLSPQGISTLKREFKNVLTSLPPATQFNIICFGTSGDIFKPKSVGATTENKNDALRWFEGYYGGASADFGRTRTEKYGRAGKDSQGIEYVPLQPADVKELAGTEGGSRIDLAMVAAFERKPSTIYVISDGAPGTKDPKANAPMDKDDLIKLIKEKHKVLMGSTTKLQVNTITVESDTADGKEGEKFMSKLARAFDGKYKKVDVKKIKGDDKEDPKK